MKATEYLKHVEDLEAEKKAEETLTKKGYKKVKCMLCEGAGYKSLPIVGATTCPRCGGDGGSWKKEESDLSKALLSPKQLMDMQFPEVVKLEQGVLDFFYSESWGRYPLEIDRIKTKEDFISWVLHLNCKVWFTSEHLRQFAEIIQKAKKWKLRLP